MMCKKCVGMIYTCDIGECELKLDGCIGYTASGAYHHCGACALKSKTCQMCQKAI